MQEAGHDDDYKIGDVVFVIDNDSRNGRKGKIFGFFRKLDHCEYAVAFENGEHGKYSTSYLMKPQ